MKTPLQVRLLLAALLLVSLFVPANHAQAAAHNATISVPCSTSALIAAINAANASPEADTLNLQAGCTYFLTSVNNTSSGPNGLPTVTGELTINGNGAQIVRPYMSYLPLLMRESKAAASALSSQLRSASSDNLSLQSASAGGMPDFRIIMVASGGSLTLNMVTLGGGHLAQEYGGAIFNAGALVVINSTITGSTAEVGGGIYNIGTLEIHGSTFSFNLAEGAGGGISSSGTLEITATLFSGNTAVLGDGFFVADGNSTVVQIDFKGDTAYLACPSFPYNVPAGDTAKLIEAMHCANSTPADEVINLSSGSTYTFTAADNDGLGSGATALPMIADAAVAGKLTINGNGATLARSSTAGTPEFRLLTTNSGADLTLNNITLQNGRLSSGAGGGISNNGGTLAINNSQLKANGAQYGGGIQANGGVLSISGSELSANYTTLHDGAAIVGNGVITVTNSRFTGNTSQGLGGGILVNGGTLTVSDSSFSGNIAKQLASGAGILIVSMSDSEPATQATISGCTFADNGGGGAGGGVFAAPHTITGITQSTFTRNDAYNGGAIWNGGAMTVSHSTITANLARGDGGGIYMSNPGATLQLSHTIVAGNSASHNSPEIYGTVASQGYNVIGSTSGATISGVTSGNLTGAAAAPLNFGPLKDNGGPTQTLALAVGSVAIDAGDPGFSAPPDFDQRGTGYPRVYGGRIDIGAYESGAGFVCPASPYTVPAGNTAALIGAINCANASLGDDVINLSSSTYTFAAADNDVQNVGATALPIILDAAVAGRLTINGNGATLTRAGTSEFRILTTNSGANLTLNNLTIQNGRLSSGAGGGISNNGGTLAINNSQLKANGAQYGGGIQANGGTLSISGSEISGNYTTLHDGAGIVGSGTITVTNSRFTGNTAEGLGGGILMNDTGGTLTVTDSTFSNNRAKAAASGAALLVVASGPPGNVALVSGCTFTGNHGDGGGGAVFLGTNTSTTITNSTFTGNSAQWGGAIANNGTLTLKHSTLSLNSAVQGGGIDSDSGKGTVSLEHAIVVGNTLTDPVNGKGPDVAGPVISQGYNLIGSTYGPPFSGTTTGDQMGVSMAQLNLGPLQDNGGPTQTMALGFASIAIDAGNPAIAGAPAYDQRGAGFPRISGGRIDIGAYESN